MSQITSFESSVNDNSTSSYRWLQFVTCLGSAVLIITAACIKPQLTLHQHRYSKEDPRSHHQVTSASTLLCTRGTERYELERRARKRDAHALFQAPAGRL